MSRSFTYGYINAKLRARLSRLLTREYAMRIAATRSVTEAVAMLDDTRYAPASEIFRRTGDLKLVEAEIHGIQYAEIASIVAHLSDEPRRLAEALVTSYELESLKNAIRIWFGRVVAGRAMETALPYMIRQPAGSHLKLEPIINAANDQELLELLAGTPYQPVAAAHLPAVLESRTLYPLEIELDRWYFALLASRIEELDPKDRAVARKLLGVRIDLMNLRRIARVQEAGPGPPGDAASSILPGGIAFDARSLAGVLRADSPPRAAAELLAARYGVPGTVSDDADDIRRLTLLSSMLQEVMMHEVGRVLGGYPFSIGIVLAYEFLLRNEERMIITVLNARYYELGQELIGSVL